MLRPTIITAITITRLTKVLPPLPRFIPADAVDVRTSNARRLWTSTFVAIRSTSSDTVAIIVQVVKTEVLSSQDKPSAVYLTLFANQMTGAFGHALEVAWTALTPIRKARLSTPNVEGANQTLLVRP